VAPGFEYADYEQGRRDDLVARYHDFSTAIKRLTRTESAGQ
jgi:hypothetical protein